MFVLLALWSLSDRHYARVMFTHKQPINWTKHSTKVSDKAEAIFDRTKPNSKEIQRIWNMQQTNDVFAPYNNSNSKFAEKGTEISLHEKTYAKGVSYAGKIKTYTAGIYNQSRISPKDIADRKGLSINDTDPFDIERGMKNVTKVVEHVRENQISKSNPGKPKIIVTWNSFYDVRDYSAGGFGTTPFVHCPVSNCFLTDDHRYISESSAMLFHPASLSSFPLYRDQRQIYVFFLQEAPPYRWNNLNYEYNLTMTYRRDSDIPIPYAEVYKKPAPESFYELKFPFANRTRNVAWVVSQCDTPGKRERYVEQLKRYIDVDVYGACGNMPGCSPRIKDSECLENKIPSTYKFYLAFENSLCEDYVTEKLFRSLTTEILPIVYGGTNYSRDAPPHSVINVEDYSSPQELARYLKRLAANETEYSAYFDWNKNYGIRTRGILQRGFCILCEIINIPSFHKIYHDMRLWWSVGRCRNSTV